MRPAKPAANASPGVIETLTGGFDQVNRIPWIVSLPIVMDIFLWLAPRLSAASVFHRLIQATGDLYLSVAAAGADQSTVDQARQALADLDGSAATFNLLDLLVGGLGSLPSVHPDSVSSLGSLEIASIAGVLGIAAAGIALGMLIGCLYLGALAQQIRDGRIVALALSKRVWFYWLSALGFVALAGLVVGVAMVPVSLIVGLAEMIAPGIGTVFLVLVLAGAEVVRVLAIIYLFFLIDAIVVSEVGPIRAAANSARVVASSFWQTVGFILLVIVISRGMAIVWGALSANPAGTVVAILGNAYVETGLAAASMLYYQSRVSRLPAGQGVLKRVMNE